MFVFLVWVHNTFAYKKEFYFSDSLSMQTLLGQGFQWEKLLGLTLWAAEPHCFTADAFFFFNSVVEKKVLRLELSPSPNHTRSLAWEFWWYSMHPKDQYKTKLNKQMCCWCFGLLLVFFSFTVPFQSNLIMLCLS